VATARAALRVAQDAGQSLESSSVRRTSLPAVLPARAEARRA
jgi:hypothetical protein